MSGNVEFEGMIRISGSTANVERTLASLKKNRAVIVDKFPQHPHWPRPFPWPGMPVPLELGAVLRDPNFKKKRILDFNRTVPVKSRVRFKLLPDWGIIGWREFPHLHLGDRFLQLNDAAMGIIITEGINEVRDPIPGNEIR